jgi:hypothetical protein
MVPLLAPKYKILNKHIFSLEFESFSKRTATPD